MAASPFYSGKRLSFDGQLCTVRYYGEVKGTKGEWLGVEWDDPTRGKHSGEHGGFKYFACVSKIPTAGSFVRPTRKSDPPRSFVEALKAKYASESLEEDPDVEIVYVGKNRSVVSLAQQKKPIRISGKEAEEVGFDKIRKKLADLKELRIVILDGLCMSRPIASLRERESSMEHTWPDDLADIKGVCPKIIDLDLSRNLFEEWREIASICEQLDRLTSLRVDGNRFRDTYITEAERPRCQSAFSGIKSLKLENTLLPWEDMTNITHLFPSLTTFVASSNFFSTLTPYSLPTTITDLTLEDNTFTSLSSLEPLTTLPNLRRLILKQNKITDITAHGSPTPVFSSTLTEVDLSWNEISTWTFINSLPHVFPGLTSIRVSHNPLYQSLQAPDGKVLTAEDGYMLTVARLGQVKTLNYSPITAKERLNAESYYLSLIARELSFSSEDLSVQILASHPRYKELCEEYGEPVVKRSDNAINPNSLAARLVRLSVYLGESARHILRPTAETRKDGPVELEVPMSFTAYTLYGMVAKIFGLKPLKMKLVLETGDWMSAERRVDSVEDGDWDSESSDGESGDWKGVGKRVMREVEVVPGTRLLGTWVEGMEAVVRVEMR
ncbi:RNI-like protein [Delitschia confertaspora ATCC 74209]|uniref:RNI-like protein n=1 Tax=Delitschia confertaspora ATCC 74209 TaxID=1513339 RepID=A0A9P4JGM0_9PLEO|nr:RNI-like protein [Delitschia confertaspora ATCC 74209]